MQPKATINSLTWLSFLTRARKVAVAVLFFWLLLFVFHRMWKSVHTRQPSLSQAPLLPSEERRTKGGPGEGPVCGQQGSGRVAGKVRNRTDPFSVRTVWHYLRTQCLNNFFKLFKQVLANPWAARTHNYQGEATKQGKSGGPGAAGPHGVPAVWRRGGGGQGRPGRRCRQATLAGAAGASPRCFGTYRAGQQPFCLNPTFPTLLILLNRLPAVCAVARACPWTQMID